MRARGTRRDPAGGDRRWPALVSAGTKHEDPQGSTAGVSGSDKPGFGSGFLLSGWRQVGSPQARPQFPQL